MLGTAPARRTLLHTALLGVAVAAAGCSSSGGCEADAARDNAYARRHVLPLLGPSLVQGASSADDCDSGSGGWVEVTPTAGTTIPLVVAALERHGWEARPSPEGPEWVVVQRVDGRRLLQVFLTDYPGGTSPEIVIEVHEAQ